MILFYFPGNNTDKGNIVFNLKEEYSSCRTAKNTIWHSSKINNEHFITQNNRWCIESF